MTVTTLPPAPASNDLVVRYFVDASCTEINATLAKCSKYYVQGQKNNGSTLYDNRLGRLTDHYPDSNTFKLPYYADTSKAMTVEVAGTSIKQFDDWDLSLGSPTSIIMKTTNNTLKAFDTQLVKISFYVDETVYNVMYSKKAALNEIKTMCSCPDLRCNLSPVKNAAGVISDYACLYPPPDATIPPSSQTVYLSAKTVPVRYFDSSGAPQAAITGSSTPQEGKAFQYLNNNLLTPNNMPSATVTDPYVGFNEIYGSLTYGVNTAQPAKEVQIISGKTYDIYVDRGSYSTCLDETSRCGNIY